MTSLLSFVPTAWIYWCQPAFGNYLFPYSAASVGGTSARVPRSLELYYAKGGDFTTFHYTRDVFMVGDGLMLRTTSLTVNVIRCFQCTVILLREQMLVTNTRFWGKKHVFFRVQNWKRRCRFSPPEQLMFTWCFMTVYANAFLSVSFSQTFPSLHSSRADLSHRRGVKRVTVFFFKLSFRRIPFTRQLRAAVAGRTLVSAAPLSNSPGWQDGCSHVSSWHTPLLPLPQTLFHPFRKHSNVIIETELWECKHKLSHIFLLVFPSHTHTHK